MGNLRIMFLFLVFAATAYGCSLNAETKQYLEEAIGEVAEELAEDLTEKVLS